MKRIAALFAAALVALLTGCGQPLPQDKLAYAGEWRGAGMWLLITPEGRCEYERRTGSGTRSIQAPVQRFEGDNFVVGLGPMSTTFVVSSPPRLVEGQWKMTVDGVELTRVGAAGEIMTEERVRPDIIRA
jgi:hypothetical protein